MMNLCGFFVLLAAVSSLGYVSDARFGALERLMKPRICSTVQFRWLSMALPANFRGSILNAALDAFSSNVRHIGVKSLSVC